MELGSESDLGGPISVDTRTPMREVPRLPQQERMSDICQAAVIIGGGQHSRVACLNRAARMCLVSYELVNQVSPALDELRAGLSMKYEL